LQFRLVRMKVYFFFSLCSLSLWTRIKVLCSECLQFSLKMSQLKRYILSSWSDAEKFCSILSNPHNFEELLSINPLIFLKYSLEIHTYRVIYIKSLKFRTLLKILSRNKPAFLHPSLWTDAIGNYTFPSDFHSYIFWIKEKHALCDSFIINSTNE